MNFTQQISFLFLILLLFTQSSTASWGLGSDAGMNTWVDIKGTFAKGAEVAIKVIQDHPKVASTITYGTAAAVTQSGIIIAVGPVVGAGYICYRLYQRLIFKSAEIALKEQEVENARKMHEILEREIRIKEEAAKIAREIMLQNAKIRNILLISSVATAAALGIGYAGYKFYKNRKQQQDIFTAKKTLLDAVITNEHNEIGQFKLPRGCAQAAGTLLAFPGGRQALDEVVDSLQYPLVAQVN